MSSNIVVADLGLVNENYTSPNELVVSGWNQAQTYAADAFTQANTFLDDIANIGEGLAAIPDVSTDLAAPVTVLSPLTLPDSPDRPDGLAMNLPVIPTEPTLDTVLPLDAGTAPEFAATSPDVDLSIAAPTPFSQDLPVEPQLSTVTLPDAVALAIPDAPDLVGINLPSVPVLNLPTFSATVPEAPLAPDVGTFSFAETQYTSTLLEALKARLLEWVNGAATGIAAAVEQAIWNRAREREALNASRKVREVSREFARRGFSKPQGALSVALNDALQELQNRDAELSRDVAIKQAELEQSNRRFAFEQAWQVESGLISYSNQIAQRAFEAAKFALSIAVEVYQARVAQFDAEVKAFGVRADAFRVELQAELAHLEVFRAEIEAQKLVGEINQQQVEVYRALLEGVKARIDVYRTEVEAANVMAAVNRTVIEAYGARVGAYEALVKAKAAEYDGYATRVKAEVSKVDVFRAQADAYRSQVEGFTALVNARAQEKAIELKIKQEAPIDLFKARTEAFRSLVGAEGERVRAEASAYQADADVYRSTVQALSSRADAEATLFKAESDVQVAEGNLRIEAAKANIQKLMQQVTLLSESVRAGAQVSAQLAAAALSAVNLSGGISSSDSFNASVSENTSTSTATSTSTNANTSDSTSTSTSYSHIYQHDA